MSIVRRFPIRVIAVLALIGPGRLNEALGGE